MKYNTKLDPGEMVSIHHPNYKNCIAEVIRPWPGGPLGNYEVTVIRPPTNRKGLRGKILVFAMYYFERVSVIDELLERTKIQDERM